jgi:hypothetical protein
MIMGVSLVSGLTVGGPLSGGPAGRPEQPGIALRLVHPRLDPAAAGGLDRHLADPALGIGGIDIVVGLHPDTVA